jgi:methionyl-tRNA formyltransferase
MRIVFIGAVEFSLRALEKVLSLNANVVGVCTLKTSSFNSDFVDLTVCSNKKNIPSIYVDDINSPTSLEWIANLNPDVVFCFGLSRLLKSGILNVAPMGVVGFHPAALPANRGRHPIIWALALGLTETASTFFFMNEGADSGDILSQSFIPINDYDDARSLYDKVVSKALDQIEEFLPKLIDKDYDRIAQDDSKSNTWRKRGREDGVIDWRMSATSIHNLVRALGKPYVGAEFHFNEVNYKVWKTEVIVNDVSNIEPGKVVDIDSSGFPVVKCGDKAIKLIYTEPVFRITKGISL